MTEITDPAPAPIPAVNSGGAPVASNLNQYGHRISFREAFAVWLRIALLSFGGPAGQIAVMHRILVEEKQWISERRFLHALNYCMVLPGPEAQQLVTYIGWMLHGAKGGLVAGGLFILPGFVSILLLSLLYAGLQDASLVQALFFGIKAAVLAIVIQAVIRIGKRAIRTVYMLGLAVAAFTGIFFFSVPFPIVIILAGLAGLTGHFIDPHLFSMNMQHSSPAEAQRTIDTLLDSGAPAHVRASRGRAFRVLAVWLPLWFLPLIAIAGGLGFDHVFSQIGLFFSKLAVVTFGGAYSVLAYMTQESVQNYGWLAPGEMLDGLGMAETTPGPLIQVVQFVAFMGAFRDAGSLDPMMAGVLASILATWVTFVPCFLWIFLGAPYVEILNKNEAIKTVLSAVTAAVVGVMLNLAIWLSIHVAFTEVAATNLYGLQLPVPALPSIQWMSVVLTAVAFTALLVFRLNVPAVIALCVALGMGYHFLP